MDIQDILAKIVDAAQNDMATQLGSLEETVLTLAEALLRPNGQARFQERTQERTQERAQERAELRPAPAPRDGAEV
jgi:Mg2+ and Co2+ transporter CorA